MISDIPPDHPDLDNCANIIVRVLPNSTSRIHLRKIGQFKVIIFPQGYLSAFKGFVRLWLRGCALGKISKKKRSAHYNAAKQEYLAAIQNSEAALVRSATAYVGTLLQLVQNERPFMDGESIFDGEVISKEDSGAEFGRLSLAIDGFLLFHEISHVLKDDDPTSDRSLQMELSADLGSVSLCIIDEARRGGFGTVHLGAPLYFAVELLSLLIEEIYEIQQGRHNPESGRYPGIDEIMFRSQLFHRHVNKYLGKRITTLLQEWQDAISPVFDTVRWVMLSSISQPGQEVSLSSFLGSRPNVDG